MTEIINPKHLYVGNKMVGVPYFNAPWFDHAEKQLLTYPRVKKVFNPAENDRDNGLDPMKFPTGELEYNGTHFDRREALLQDWTWISKHSTGMVAGPQWMDSTGTISEIACHQALGLPVWEYRDFLLFGHDDTKLIHRVMGPVIELSYRVKQLRDLEAWELTDDGVVCDC